MYKFESFAGVTLPQAEFNTDISPGQARTNNITGGGSGYDGWGSDDAPVRYPFAVQHRGVVVASTLATMRSTIDDLRALIGRQAPLYRRALDDNTIHWAWARLINVQEQRQPLQMFAQPLTFRFDVWSQWHGTHHDTSTTLDTSPKDIVYANSGNAPVTDFIITVTAGSADITLLTVSKPYGSVSWYYDATIAAGESLVFNTASWSVLNDGDADIAHLHRNAVHAITPWMRLISGNNTVRVAITGGSTDSTIVLDYYDGWV